MTEEREPDPDPWPQLPASWSGPADGGVDCLCVRLGDVAAAAQLQSVVTPQEAVRAGAFRAPGDRKRALVARAALRLLLTRCTGDGEPGAIPITTGQHGKPMLAGGPQFNLSHGGDVVLFAFAAVDPVGVDVEPHSSGVARLEVVHRLQWEERAMIEQASNKNDAFLRVWTRKEAVAKARGVGVFGMDIEFEAAPYAQSDTGFGFEWSIHDLRPAPRHIGALATTTRAPPRFWRYTPEG